MYQRSQFDLTSPLTSLSSHLFSQRQHHHHHHQQQQQQQQQQDMPSNRERNNIQNNNINMANSNYRHHESFSSFTQRQNLDYRSPLVPPLSSASLPLPVSRSSAPSSMSFLLTPPLHPRPKVHRTSDVQRLTVEGTYSPTTSLTSPTTSVSSPPCSPSPSPSPCSPCSSPNCRRSKPTMRKLRRRNNNNNNITGCTNGLYQNPNNNPTYINTSTSTTIHPNHNNNNHVTTSKLRSTISKKVRSSKSNIPGTSRYWTPSEHKLFVEALIKYGPKDLKSISKYVGTRNMIQCRTHEQKCFMRLMREAQRDTLIRNGHTLSDPCLTKLQKDVYSVPQSCGISLLCTVTEEMARSLEQ